MTQPKEQTETYGQILKSTSIIGGSSVIVVCLRIIRTKATAILLGPSGVGLIGIYSSIIELLFQVVGMGIGRSGVRQIAEAVGTKDNYKISKTIFVLRRTTIFLGLVGIVDLLFLRNAIGKFTFGNTDHAGALGILSISLFFLVVSNGQKALIQGLRRISDIARLNIFGAFFGMCFGIPLVYFWGEHGIVPFLVMISTMGFLTSWWYARKISVENIRFPMKEIVSETLVLLRLGAVFMVTGFMSMGTLYSIKMIIVRLFGLDAVGFYQASSSISSLYVGFILTAMGTDFFPRLTAVASDNLLCNRIVNEQVEVGLLLAVPGILATLVFAPYVIEIFYSDKFSVAVDILRWELLGILLRVASWPLGFILIAKGKGSLFLFTQSTYSIIHVSLAYLFLKIFGLPGAGMAFFGLYISCWILNFGIVKRLSRFSFTKKNMKLTVLIIPSVFIVFSSQFFLPGLLGTIVGASVTLIVGICLLNLLRIAIGKHKLRTFISRLKSNLFEPISKRF